MTPKEKVEEWSKALWKRGVIDNFKKLDKKTRFEVRYYFTFSLQEFIQRCIRCSGLRNNRLLLTILKKNALDLIKEFREADETGKEEK